MSKSGCAGGWGGVGEEEGAPKVALKKGEDKEKGGRRNEFLFGKETGLRFIYMTILTSLGIKEMVKSYYKDKTNYQPYRANMLPRIDNQ